MGLEFNASQFVYESFTVFNVVRIFAVLTLAFFVTMIITPAWLRMIKHYNLGQQIKPAKRAPKFHEMHKHKQGTPNTGGVLIWGTVTAIVFIFWFLDHATGIDFFHDYNFFTREQTWIPIAALIIAGVLGLIDDLLGALRIGPNGGGLRMKVRVGLMALLAFLGAGWFFFKLDFDTINIPFFGDYFVGPWYFIFFVIVILATSFSANETDGLDGLAGGVFLTMYGAYAVIAFTQGRMDLVVLIAAIIGSLIAFLWHNIFPARFFMGDTGSMSLGIVIGIIAMFTNTPLLLIPIGIVFVVESGSVIIQMISKKYRNKKVFLSTPLHHHFEAKKIHETTITMRFWMVSIVGALIGVIIFLIDSKLAPLG